MFLSQYQIENAINALTTVQPFFGIDFLTCKLINLPIAHKSNIQINQQVEEFLKNYYQPELRSQYFFRVFRVSDKNKYWLNPDYAWKGSQSVRTRTFGDTFLHEKGSNQWGWKKDYIQLLWKHLKNKHLPAFALAVWLYRDRKWLKDTSANTILEAFYKEFNITEPEKEKLFDVKIPKWGTKKDLLSDTRYSWTDISTSLNIPDPEDVPFDEGGTLSALTIEGVGPVRKLELELAQRVNLFTGDNGLGKSFILESAWYALSETWTSFSAYPRPNANRNEPKIVFQIHSELGRLTQNESVYNWDRQEWVSRDNTPAIPGLLIYARIDGAFAVWDPARDYWANPEKKLSKPIVFTREQIWNGLKDTIGGRTIFVANGLMADWILWQNSPEKQPFATLKSVLKRLSPPDLEHGDLGILEPGKPTRVARDSRWIPTIKHSYGEVPLIYASAGVRRIVALAYLIVWAWEEHKTQSKLIRKEPQRKIVILIDEIEAHLHPKWQRRILPALLKVQEDLAPNISMQLLAATHSPLVMASIEPFFDETRDKIFHLDLVRNNLLDAEVELKEPDFVRYGTVDSWLRSDIFELPQARSEEAEKAIEDAKELQLRDHVTKVEVEEVSQRLVKYLPAHDRFWPRWTFFAEEHGVDL